MNTNNLKLVDQQFPLPYNGYAAFDAVTLKQLMLDRLNQNTTFTDQIYEGSNFNSFIDVIAYSYNVLMYYLNKTSNESSFATAQIYENMNKIVKILNYNPVGFQSCILKFQATANLNLQPDIYTIPKYSYFTINEKKFNFVEDVTFLKTLTGQEFLKVLSDESWLVQGEWVEHPVYTATGSPYELFTIVATDTAGENVKIDHNGIDVYVKNSFGKWEQWTRVDSLFLSNGNDKVFEVRLNENQRYEIKFGNNITGKQLEEDNRVAVYYLKTDSNLGVTGPNTINNQKLFQYNTQQFKEIMGQIRDPNIKIITFAESNNIVFSNNTGSSISSPPESTNSIRENAPNIFKAQNRLITTTDFQSYIKTNYKRFVQDVKVVNNWEYLDGHMKYLFNIGLKSASEDSRVLYNQVKFADSCNFNDIYIYLLPKTYTNNSLTSNSAYLNSSVKRSIINDLNKVKMATMEPIPMDPVYVAVSFGIKKEVAPETDSVESILHQTKLVLRKSSNTYTNDNSIKAKVLEIFKRHFASANVSLGMQINTDLIVGEILNIGGVSGVFTSRKIGEEELLTEGISFVIYNPVYSGIEEDVITTSQNIILPYFKIPYLYDENIIKNNILIAPVNYIDAGVREY